MKKLMSTLLLVSILLSCKNNTSTHSGHTHELHFSEELPQDFLMFYVKFHGDALYQKEHILFPLKVKEDGTPWLKEEWITHQSFDDQGGQFSQKFMNMSGLIIEKIESVDKLFKMERRFMKNQDAYQLIYYKVENAFEGSDDWESGTGE